MVALLCQALLSVRMAALIIVGISLLEVGIPISGGLLMRIVDSKSLLNLVGWHPVFDYWWKWSVMLLWGQFLFPFLIGFTAAQLARAKEMVICGALATWTEASVLTICFRNTFIEHSHIQTGWFILNSWPMVALVLAGAFARRRALNSLLID